MANNRIQVKRTSVSGRLPNTTSVGNSSYITAGELALNLTDGILYSSNGSSIIPIGANNVNINVTGNLTANSIVANGSVGSAGQYLTSDGSRVYWSTSQADGVLQVNTGIGLTGGPITNTGTISVNPNTGIVANSTGLFVNAAYIATVTVNNALNANNANNLGGVAAASYVQNTDSRTLSGNLYFTGTNNYFDTAVYVGNSTAVSVIANTTGLFPASNTVGTTFGSVNNRWTIIGTSATLSSTLSVSGTVNIGGAVNFNAATQNINATSFTTGTVNIGGATQTGAINIGRSTANQTLSIANGATASGSTKVVNIGTEGLAGSTTTINIGSSASSGNVNINSNTVISGITAVQSLSANSSLGSNGQLLTSNGSAVYWNDPAYVGSTLQFRTDSFTGNGSVNTYSLSYATSTNNALVFINGVEQEPSSAYTVSGSTITFSENIANGATIEVKIPVTTTYTGTLAEFVNYVYTAANNQTSFSGADNNGRTLEYSPGYIVVYINGVKMVDTVDYTAANGTHVVLTTGAANNDVVEVVSHSTLAIVQSNVSTNNVTLGTSASISSNSLTTSTTAQQNVDAFSTSSFRSASYFVQVTDNTNNQYHAQNITLVHNGSAVSMAEFGAVYTANSLATFDATISSGMVYLQVTPVTANSTIRVARTAMVV